MKLGCFITITRPHERGDLFEECLNSAKDMFDVVTVIDGEETWPHEFTWKTIGEHFQRGYEQCDADWVFHLDVDFILHEQDFKRIREACEQHYNEPALTFLKYQFILPDRYNIKSRLVLAVNKARYGDRITFSSGGDLCQPALDGEYIDPGRGVETKIPFYNYDKILKTKEQIAEDQGRMERAWKRHFGDYQMSKDGTNEDSYNVWMKMQKGRFNKPQKHISLSEHPKYMQETIKNLTPEQFGYDGHGKLERNDYVKSMLSSR